MADEIPNEDTIAICGDYQMVDVKYVDSLNLQEFAEDRDIPVKVVDGDRLLFTIELPDDRRRWPKKSGVRTNELTDDERDALRSRIVCSICGERPAACVEYDLKDSVLNHCCDECLSGWHGPVFRHDLPKALDHIDHLEEEVERLRDFVQWAFLAADVNAPPRSDVERFLEALQIRACELGATTEGGDTDE